MTFEFETTYKSEAYKFKYLFLRGTYNLYLYDVCLYAIMSKLSNFALFVWYLINYTSGNGKHYANVFDAIATS